MPNPPFLSCKTIIRFLQSHHTIHLSVHLPMLHQKLLQARKHQGLTQEELADRTGITVRTIQRIENGENVPRMYTLKTIASVLGISLEELQQEQTASADGTGAYHTEESIHFLQMLTLSCFSYIVLPYFHFLV